MLSRGSRDVFTARSVQELWLINSLPATGLAGADVKGIYLLKTLAGRFSFPCLYQAAVYLRFR